MKTIMFYVIMSLVLCHCKAQEELSLTYICYQYKGTQNRSFLNKELILKTDGDTIRMNLRLPYDSIHHNVIDRGLLYNCHLKKGVKYTFTLQKKCIFDIPSFFNSYYRTNTIPDKNDYSKFIEIKKDTEYDYRGDYGRYVDIKGCLYEIKRIYPNNGGFYPH